MHSHLLIELSRPDLLLTDIMSLLKAIKKSPKKWDKIDFIYLSLKCMSFLYHKVTNIRILTLFLCTFTHFRLEFGFVEIYN